MIAPEDLVSPSKRDSLVPALQVKGGPLEVLGNELEPETQEWSEVLRKAEDGHGPKLVSAAGVP